MRHPRRLLPALLLAALPLGLALTARAQDGAAAQWPKPAANWWEKLKAGDRAVYEVHQGEQSMKLVITIDKVEAAQVTYSAQTFLGGDQPTPRQTQTIDARTDRDANDDLPPDAKVKKLAEEKVEVGGRTFACTVFEIVLENATIKAWHCPELPPIFSASNVKVEAVSQGEPSSLRLIDLTLASAAAAPAPGGDGEKR